MRIKTGNNYYIPKTRGNLSIEISSRAAGAPTNRKYSWVQLDRLASLVCRHLGESHFLLRINIHPVAKVARICSISHPGTGTALVWRTGHFVGWVIQWVGLIEKVVYTHWKNKLGLTIK